MRRRPRARDSAPHGRGTLFVATPRAPPRGTRAPSRGSHLDRELAKARHNAAERARRWRWSRLLVPCGSTTWREWREDGEGGGAACQERGCRNPQRVSTTEREREGGGVACEAKPKRSDGGGVACKGRGCRNPLPWRGVSGAGVPEPPTSLRRTTRDLMVERRESVA